MSACAGPGIATGVSRLKGRVLHRLPACGRVGYLAGGRPVVESGTGCEAGYQLNY